MDVSTYDIYTGSLLVASPYLSDSNFRASVVMVTYQMQEKILGLVLNRSTDHKLKDFCDEDFASRCPVDAELYLGGPVPGPLVAVHRQPEYADITSPGDYCLTISGRAIDRMIFNLKPPYRFYIGCASWTVEQLAQELEDGYWHLLAPGQLDLFAEDTDLWACAMTTSAQISLTQVAGLTQLPSDPEVN